MYQVCWIWYLWPCGSNPFFLPPQRTWYTPEGLSRCNPAKNWWQRFAVVCSLSQRLWQRSCPITCWSNGFLDQQVCWELEGTVSSLSGIDIGNRLDVQKQELVNLTYQILRKHNGVIFHIPRSFIRLPCPCLTFTRGRWTTEPGLAWDCSRWLQGTSRFKWKRIYAWSCCNSWWGHYVYMYLIHMKSTYITKKKACIACHKSIKNLAAKPSAGITSRVQLGPWWFWQPLRAGILCWSTWWIPTRSRCASPDCLLPSRFWTTAGPFGGTMTGGNIYRSNPIESPVVWQFQTFNIFPIFLYVICLWMGWFSDETFQGITLYEIKRCSGNWISFTQILRTYVE